MTFHVSLGDKEEFSAFKTADRILAMVGHADKGEKIQIKLKGFNRAQANAVYYLLAQSTASSLTERATGFTQVASNHKEMNIDSSTPGIGNISRRHNPVDGSTHIMFHLEPDIALPIHAIRETLKEEKRFFGLAENFHNEHEGRAYNMLPLDSLERAEQVLAFMKPVIHGHGYRSKNDVLVREIEFPEVGTAHTILIDQDALAYVMKQENIGKERLR